MFQNVLKYDFYLNKIRFNCHFDRLFNNKKGMKKSVLKLHLL